LQALDLREGGEARWRRRRVLVVLQWRLGEGKADEKVKAVGLQAFFKSLLRSREFFASRATHVLQNTKLTNKPNFFCNGTKQA